MYSKVYSILHSTLYSKMSVSNEGRETRFSSGLRAAYPGTLALVRGTVNNLVYSKVQYSVNIV